MSRAEIELRARAILLRALGSASSPLGAVLPAGHSAAPLPLTAPLGRGPAPLRR
jgi:hypothetical protein